MRAVRGMRGVRGVVQRRVLVVAVLVLLVVNLGLLLPRGTLSRETRRGYHAALDALHGTPFCNLVLIGWDGCLKEDVDRLLAQGKLPALRRLMAQGQVTDTYVTQSRTETKPGWAEILTGYGPATTGVYDNRSWYGAIPTGYTVFERLKQAPGLGPIKMVFLAGKAQNLGIRGRHRVRVHGHRKTWFDEKLWSPAEARMPDVVEHEAEPYYNTWQHVDVFKNGLGDAPNVTRAMLEALRGMGKQRFFVFAHYWEPDESGHEHGEGSAAYLQALEANDVGLGQLLDALQAQGLDRTTRIYLTTDHGFDPGARTHGNAPHTFVVTNDTWPLRRQGDRKDITPTILERFGVRLEGLQPRLEGRSLLQ